MADSQQKQQQPPELVFRGITVGDFNRWKHSPVTRLFRKYLTDKSADVKAATMDLWLGGGLDLAVEQEARSTVNAYETMASLLGPDGQGGSPKLAEIASFYDEVDHVNAQQARDDAAEDDETAQDHD